MSICFGIKERKKEKRFFFGRERGWFSGEDIDLVKGGERNIEKVGFFGRDREKVMSRGRGNFERSRE